MHATLQQLRLIEAVARLGGVTAAARALHLTQPAVSIQIKRLEESVGLPLFEQIGRRLHLTAVGAEVVEAARDVLGRIDRLDEEIDALRGTIRGTLRLTTVASASYFLPLLLGAFLRRHPEVTPRLKVTNRAALLDSLAANEDDFYVMGQVPEGLAVATRPFLENVVGWVAPPDHPLTRRRALPVSVVTEQRVLVRERGSGTRSAVERVCEAQGVPIVPYMELGSDETLKQGVLAGLGIAAMSLHTLSLELHMGRLAVLDVKGFPLRRRWFAIHHKGKRLSRVAEAFIAFLESEGAALVARELGPL